MVISCLSYSCCCCCYWFMICGFSFVYSLEFDPITISIRLFFCFSKIVNIFLFVFLVFFNQTNIDDTVFVWFLVDQVKREKKQKRKHHYHHGHRSLCYWVLGRVFAQLIIDKCRVSSIMWWPNETKKKMMENSTGLTELIEWILSIFLGYYHHHHH